MSEPRRRDHLDEWMLRIRAELLERGIDSTLGYDDRLLGDILVLRFSGPSPCELVVTRNRRGRARIAALAESEAAAGAAAAAVQGAHQSILRLANAMRTFVHRVERVLQHLADEWQVRGGAFPTEALERVRRIFPEAKPMRGIGYHIDHAGGEERRGKRARGEHYETIYAIALPIAGVPRALPWDPALRAFVATPAAYAELRQRAGATTDLAGHAIAPRAGMDADDAAVAAAATGLVGGLAMVPPSQRERWCDLGVDVCDVIDCGFELPDLADAVSSCIPDCDGFDIPSCDGCDVGGLDCS